MGGQAVGVEQDLVLALEASQRCHLGDPRNRLQGRTYREVLQLAQLSEIELPGRVLQDVLVDPADAGGVGTEHRGGVWRQQPLRPPHLLEHPRARPVEIGSVHEDDVDEAHPEHRVAADGLDVGRALEGAHQGVGDLIFDQVRAAPHPVGEHDDLRVRQVRHRIERRALGGKTRPDQGGGNQRHHEESVPGAGFDDAGDHVNDLDGPGASDRPLAPGRRSPAGSGHGCGRPRRRPRAAGSPNR